MKKRLTITIEIEQPDEFESFDDLEGFVREAGQQIQQRLCRELAEEVARAAESPHCPKCHSYNTVRKGQKNRVLKTSFGDVRITRPRHRCKECGHHFFG